MLKQSMRYSLFGLIGLILLGFFIWFCQQSGNLTAEITLATVIITIILLVTGWVMEYLAALIFLSVIIILKLAPANITFSGFTSPGFWLIFAGIVIGMSIKKSGLVNRISGSLLIFFKGNYAILVTGMVVFGMLIAFIMPSAMGRVMLMLPILMEFAKVNGFPEGSRGYNGLVLAGVFGSYIAGFAILPSNLPNVVLMGATKSLYHKELIYAHYLLLHFPVLGLIKSLLLIAVVSLWFKDQPQALINHESTKTKSIWQRQEVKLVAYLSLVLIAWLSDSLTHLSPAWPALLMAVICLMPRIGIIDHKLFIKEANLAPLFYVAGIIGLATVVSYTGVGQLIGKKLIDLLPFSAHHDALNFGLLALSSALIGLVTTLPGVPAIMTPLSANLSHVTNMPLSTVIMTQVLGYSVFILPYQAPPILVAMRLGNIPLKEVSKLCLVMALLSMVVLLPVDYAWWKLIGIF